jgi:hypothetical protein
VLAIVVPALTALVSFLRFDDRSNMHHHAAAKFASLKRQLQILLVGCIDNHDFAKAENVISRIRGEWDQLTLQSPALYKRDLSESLRHHHKVRKVRANKIKYQPGSTADILNWEAETTQGGSSMVHPDAALANLGGAH